MSPWESPLYQTAPSTGSTVVSVGIPTLPDRALDRLYPMPRPTRTIEEWVRLHHRDLPDLSDLDLDREAFAVARRLCRDRDACRVAWLVERRDAVRAERRRRIDPDGRLVAADRRSTPFGGRSAGRGRPASPHRPLLVRRGGEVVEL